MDCSEKSRQSLTCIHCNDRDYLPYTIYIRLCTYPISVPFKQELRLNLLFKRSPANIITEEEIVPLFFRKLRIHFFLRFF